MAGTLPTLFKAARTRDLRSYSLSTLVMNNVGNVLQGLYIVSLPVGPIYLMHGFASGSTLLMLVWYLRFARRTTEPGNADARANTQPRGTGRASGTRRPRWDRTTS
jgi:hypothetical protein